MKEKGNDWFLADQQSILIPNRSFINVCSAKGWPSHCTRKRSVGIDWLFIKARNWAHAISSWRQFSSLSFSLCKRIRKRKENLSLKKIAIVCSQLSCISFSIIIFARIRPVLSLKEMCASTRKNQRTDDASNWMMERKSSLKHLLLLKERNER